MRGPKLVSQLISYSNLTLTASIRMEITGDDATLRKRRLVTESAKQAGVAGENHWKLMHLIIWYYVIALDRALCSSTTYTLLLPRYSNHLK